MAFPVPSAPPKFSLEQISCMSKLNVAFAFEQLDKHSYILGCFQNLRVFALHDDCGIASWGPLRTGVHGYGHRPNGYTLYGTVSLREEFFPHLSQFLHVFPDIHTDETSVCGVSQAQTLTPF